MADNGTEFRSRMECNFKPLKFIKKSYFSCSPDPIYYIIQEYPSLPLDKFATELPTHFVGQVMKNFCWATQNASSVRYKISHSYGTEFRNAYIRSFYIVYIA